MTSAAAAAAAAAAAKTTLTKEQQQDLARNTFMFNLLDAKNNQQTALYDNFYRFFDWHISTNAGTDREPLLCDTPPPRPEFYNDPTVIKVSELLADESFRQYAMPILAHRESVLFSGKPSDDPGRVYTAALIAMEEVASAVQSPAEPARKTAEGVSTRGKRKKPSPGTSSGSGGAEAPLMTSKKARTVESEDAAKTAEGSRAAAAAASAKAAEDRIKAAQAVAAAGKPTKKKSDKLSSNRRSPRFTGKTNKAVEASGSDGSGQSDTGAAGNEPSEVVGDTEPAGAKPSTSTGSGGDTMEDVENALGDDEPGGDVGNVQQTGGTQDDDGVACVICQEKKLDGPPASLSANGKRVCEDEYCYVCIRQATQHGLCTCPLCRCTYDTIKNADTCETVADLQRDYLARIKKAADEGNIELARQAIVYLCNDEAVALFHGRQTVREEAINAIIRIAGISCGKCNKHDPPATVMCCADGCNYSRHRECLKDPPAAGDEWRCPACADNSTLDQELAVGKAVQHLTSVVDQAEKLLEDGGERSRIRTKLTRGKEHNDNVKQDYLDAGVALIDALGSYASLYDINDCNGLAAKVFERLGSDIDIPDVLTDALHIVCQAVVDQFNLLPKNAEIRSFREITHAAVDYAARKPRDDEDPEEAPSRLLTMVNNQTKMTDRERFLAILEIVKGMASDERLTKEAAVRLVKKKLDSLNSINSGKFYELGLKANAYPMVFAELTSDRSDTSVLSMLGHESLADRQVLMAAAKKVDNAMQVDEKTRFAHCGLNIAVAYAVGRARNDTDIM